MPPALEDDEPALAAHNLAVAGRVNLAGRSYVTPAVLKGRQMIRVSIGAQATEREHVEALWRELCEAAVAQQAARP
jgi:aromatic-L-amino-acid decarboxylase